MANKRIIDLTATTTPSGYVALDHETNGTKKLDVTKISPVDSTLSSSSTNAVQNKVINTALSGKLATNGNSQNNTVAFTSGDVANDAAATSWTANVATLATGLTHANLFNRISTMMKNVRYLYNAVTKLNTDLTTFEDFKDKVTLVDGLDFNSQFYRIGKVASINMQTTQRTFSENDLLFTLPSGYRVGNSTRFIGSINRTPCVITLESNGECRIYDNIQTSQSRLYFMITYLIVN